MAYKVWLHVFFPNQQEYDPYKEMERFVESRQDLEIEGLNQFARPVKDYPDPQEDGGQGQPNVNIVIYGDGVELLCLAPDEEKGPEYLLTLVKEIGRRFADVYIIDAMRDYSDEDRILELEFTAKELNRELESGRRLLQ